MTLLLLELSLTFPSTAIFSSVFIADLVFIRQKADENGDRNEAV